MNEPGPALRGEFEALSPPHFRSSANHVDDALEARRDDVAGSGRRDADLAARPIAFPTGRLNSSPR